MWKHSVGGRVPVYGSAAPGATHRNDKHVYYASPLVRYELFGGKEQTIPMLDACLKLVNNCLPLYKNITANRWPVDDVIQECGNDLDKAWLYCLWRYSALMTKPIFAAGLFEWPPLLGTPAGSEPTTTPSSVAGSGSASSGAPPPL